MFSFNSSKIVAWDAPVNYVNVRAGPPLHLTIWGTKSLNGHTDVVYSINIKYGLKKTNNTLERQGQDACGANTRCVSAEKRYSWLHRREPRKKGNLVVTRTEPGEYNNGANIAQETIPLKITCFYKRTKLRFLRIRGLRSRGKSMTGR